MPSRSRNIASARFASKAADHACANRGRRRSDSVLAWRLGAEGRDQLLHPGLAALGALWRPFLQAVVFADRDAYLKVLAARLALELVDSHDFSPLTLLTTSNYPRRQAPWPSRPAGRAKRLRQSDANVDGNAQDTRSSKMAFRPALFWGLEVSRMAISELRTDWSSDGGSHIRRRCRIQGLLRAHHAPHHGGHPIAHESAYLLRMLADGVRQPWIARGLCHNDALRGQRQLSSVTGRIVEQGWQA